MKLLPIFPGGRSHFSPHFLASLNPDDFIHVYSPGHGLTAPWEQNVCQQNILSLWSFVASFKKISLKSDFIHFFHDFIHVYSPGALGRQPPGDKVLMSTEMSRHFIHL